MFYGSSSWIKTPQTSDSSFSLKFPASSFTPLPVSVILNTQDSHRLSSFSRGECVKVANWEICAFLWGNFLYVGDI